MKNLIDTDSLLRIQYGMYVVTACEDDKLNGQIVTTVMQVTCEPFKISVCLSKNTLTHEMIERTCKFGVSILAKSTPMTFIGRFGFRSGRNFDKFVDINFEKNISGVPFVLDHALVVMEGLVEQNVDVGTHTIFVAKLQSCKKISDGVALTYEYYHDVMKGKSPKEAPTCIKKSNKE